MIKIVKEPLPPKLAEKAEQWENELKRCLEEGIDPKDSLLNKYRHPEFKKRLIKETNGKCAYCESPVEPIDYGDVEHILPKSKIPDRRLDFTNLTIACRKCNGYKSDYYDEEHPLVDPYDDEPEEHIGFAGADIVDELCTPEGALTRRELDLNREKLSRERKRILRNLCGKIKDYEASSEDMRRYSVLLNIWDFAESSEPYAGMCRQWIALWKIEPDPKNRQFT